MIEKNALWARRRGAETKEWEPPIAWPSLRKKHTQQVTKAIIVHNGHGELGIREIEAIAKAQAANCFKEYECKDFEVLETVRLKNLDGWVVVVQNKI